MAEAHYQFPQTTETNVDPQLINEIESAFVDVETGEQLRPYAFVKEIEAEIQAWHATIDPTALPDRIEYESDLGGVLLGNEEARENVKAYHNRVDRARRALARILALNPNSEVPVRERFWFVEGDWFYERIDGPGSMVARYYFTDNEAVKLVHGLPVPFAKDEARGIDEKANLLKLIPLFRRAVVKKQPQQSDFDLAA